MRQTTNTTLAFLQTGIQLTQRERDALIRASRIAEEVRERARQIDPDFEDHWLDLELAGIEHFATYYLPMDGFLPITERSRVFG
jgi:hypothetical protein